MSDRYMELDMGSNGWKGITSYSGYDIALYREHMAPHKVVTADTLDKDCASLSEYLATVPQGDLRSPDRMEGKQWVDALLSSSKYLVLDLCLYLQDTLGVGVERADVYVEEGAGMVVRFQSHPRIVIRVLDPQWEYPSFCVVRVCIPGVVEGDKCSFSLAEGLSLLSPTMIQRVLGMEACSTCTFSNDDNSYCGAGASMYTGNCTQREAKHLAPYIDITLRGPTS